MHDVLEEQDAVLYRTRGGANCPPHPSLPSSTSDEVVAQWFRAPATSRVRLCGQDVHSVGGNKRVPVFVRRAVFVKGSDPSTWRERARQNVFEMWRDLGQVLLKLAVARYIIIFLVFTV